MDPFDRFEDVPVPDQWEEIVARGGPPLAPSDPDDDDWADRSRARRRRSAWVLIGAAASVLGLIAGFLAIDVDGVGDDTGTEPVDDGADVTDRETSPSAAPSGPGSPATLAEAIDVDPGAATVPRIACRSSDDLSPIADLVRSGLPTVDFEPVDDVAELVERADVVIAGSVARVFRVDPGGRPARPGSDATTVFEVTDVSVLAGSGTVERIVVDTLWPEGPEEDPLATPIGFDGLRFVGFLVVRGDRTGDVSPLVEGMFLGCDADSGAAGASGESAVEPLQSLPRGAVGLSLDDLVAAVRALAVPAVGPDGITFSPSR